MISVPSRWSSSCCTTRAASPSSSNETGAPVASFPSIVTSTGRSTSARDGPERETPLFVDLDCLAALGDRRVDDDAVLALVVEHEQAAEDADLRRREPDAGGVVHERDHPLG